MTDRNWGLRAVGWLALVFLVAGCTGAVATREATGSGTQPSAQATVSLQGLPKNGDGYTDITVQQLADSLVGKTFTLVNVHVPYEGELPQTDLFIPYDQIEQHVAELPAKDAPIVLYCRSGNMSTRAARTLVSLGYTNVLELDGGMSAWESAGHELQSKR